MSNFNKIFNNQKNIVIGVIHFPPLVGYADFPGYEVAISNALADLKSFEAGVVDAIFIENNYDVPHKVNVSDEVKEIMSRLAKKIRLATNLPLGVSVLWNDYKSALDIAKENDYQFIRIPVFVDTVVTSYGTMAGVADSVVEYRKEISAENIALFTDIHVKHSKVISKETITQSAKIAIEKKSDALIITGNWTGQAPDLSDLQGVREVIGDFPIFIGSGGDKNNIIEIFKYATGAIVSTSLKEGGEKDDEVNVKEWKQRVDPDKVKDFVNIAHQ